VNEHLSIHNVRVRTPSKMLSLPWDSTEDFVARALTAYPTVHPVVEQFRARGVSRPNRIGRCERPNLVLL
jgi:hypothetical protein